MDGQHHNHNNPLHAIADRLPATHYADEDFRDDERRQRTHPIQGGQAGSRPPGANNGRGGPPSSNPSRPSRENHPLPVPPSFPSHASVASSSDSATRYSPSSDKVAMLDDDIDDREVLISPNRPAAMARDNSANSPMTEKAGPYVHPSVTWANSPEMNRPGPHPTLSYGGQGSFSNANAPQRKKSLVRADRARMDETDRFHHFRIHAAHMEAERTGRVQESGTGSGPNLNYVGMPVGGGQGGIAGYGLASSTANGYPGLRRGKSILAREPEMTQESGLSFLKRGATLRRKNTKSKEGYTETGDESMSQQEQQKRRQAAKPALSPWMIYCYIVTCFMPGFFLAALGYKTLDRRRAFREKVGLLTVILCLMAAVGFLTFGFTSTVCNNGALRFQAGTIQSGSMIFHGYDYSMDRFQHPGAAGVEANSNPLYTDWNAGSKDGSFLFQNVNQNCKGLITRAAGNTDIPVDGDGNLGWYFPCALHDQYGSTPPNKTDYAGGQLCHTNPPSARNMFYEARNRNVSGMQWEGPVYYSWANITNSTRNLGVYKQSVLDFDLLNWLDRRFVDYPEVFDELARGDGSYVGRDSTMELLISGNRTIADCMDDIIRVGFVDSKSIGCVAADVVLYVSLVFILSVVGIKFGMAVLFAWFFGRRLGAFKEESKEERHKRIAEVEQWTNDIYRPAPAKYRPNVGGGKDVKNARKSYLPTTSRFTQADKNSSARPFSTYGDAKRQSSFGSKGILGSAAKGSAPGTPLRTSPSNSSLPLSNFGFKDSHSRSSSLDMVDSFGRPVPFPLDPHVIAQPSPDYRPFHFQLAHTILLVTAYSESVEGLRTTLDSLATTDYPNSHKLILVIADGVVKGAGNDLSTPDIVLTMMKDMSIPKEEVEAHSYVAVADGHKRHNMCKIYSGFYDYDDETVEGSKQQRVPMILVAKVGNPLEAKDAKPGNRGKRDSQIVLMAFLQKVMFDERMTSFEYEFFNAIWRTTGVSADNYEHVLMVDADTKVFPDSVTRMVACMVQDVDIMGLCGETKIANKSETWVTMIQVFEYYISHHQTKAFESMWGGVTCLPGCFSMYRIKAPKGDDGYWVPILANPDIVEHYSENVVDNLHKKNLLLLGEDRYLTTLMLKTFPRRKMMFCPQAYCKTVVPDTFKVLLSQRRRWINSTIHNLFELLLVRDLCGTFCFSMQFVVFMELVGTLVLPAAIAFTMYILAITCDPRTKEKPVIPLILLACILGLPGLLIVLTSRKIAYVGWMVIYLFSLPIWNAVLPGYAYFHMDDFSWGSTRKIEGEDGGDHSAKAGVFDSQSITMKRWSEWERERRYKSGSRSRDSTFETIHNRGDSPNRGSFISTSETFVSQGGDPFNPRAPSSYATLGGTSPASPPMGGRRVDNVQVLELPAPLSVTQQHQPFAHIRSTTEVYDSADAQGLVNYEQASPYQSSSSENFHPTVRTDDEYPRYAHQTESYDSDQAEREGILHSTSLPNSPVAPESMQQQQQSQPRNVYVPPPAEPRVLEHSLAAAPSSASQRTSVAPSSRGVSLYDPGPVSAPGGVVRTVKRNRRSSTNRLSSGAAPQGFNVPETPSPSLSQDATLPPGAAPRQ